MPPNAETKQQGGGEQDFFWAYTDEPHKTRREEIMKKYPEVKKLFGHCPKTKYSVTALVILQFSLAIYLRDQLWSPLYFLIAYVIGATANHALFLAIHELSHNLGFKSKDHNRLFAMFANLPIGLPYSVAFKGYHMEHHRYQGSDGIDTDVPTRLEGLLFTNMLTKTFFCFSQILFYALRPMAVRRQAFTVDHAINWVFQFAVMYLLVSTFGWGPYIYLLTSSFLAGSLHPCAGHFIAEHYVFVTGYETYSYYGPLNMLAYNVGYHNEHHDFPYIPGSRLPQLTAMAPEFYRDLPQVKSWPGTIWNYIILPHMGPFSRIKRAAPKDL